MEEGIVRSGAVFLFLAFLVLPAKGADVAIGSSEVPDDMPWSSG